MLRKRSGRRTSAASCVTRMLLVVEVRIASSRQCAVDLLERLALGLQRFGHALEHQLGGRPAPPARRRRRTSSTRAAIASTCSARSTPSCARPRRLASISAARLVAQLLPRLGAARGAGRPARCGARHRRTRSRCRAPCGRRRRRRSAAHGLSVAVVQPLLAARRGVRAGQAERFEVRGPLAQVAAEEAADDREQAVRDRRVDAGEARRRGEEGEAELGVLGDVAVRVQVDVLAPVARLDELLVRVAVHPAVVVVVVGQRVVRRRRSRRPRAPRCARGRAGR